jgi:hypothetical protein
MLLSAKDNLSDCKIRYLGLTRLGWSDYLLEITRLYKDVCVHAKHTYQVKNDIKVGLKIKNFPTLY